MTDEQLKSFMASVGLIALRDLHRDAPDYLTNIILEAAEVAGVEPEQTMKALWERLEGVVEELKA